MDVQQLKFLLTMTNPRPQHSIQEGQIQLAQVNPQFPSSGHTKSELVHPAPIGRNHRYRYQISSLLPCSQLKKPAYQPVAVSLLLTDRVA